MPKKLTQEEFWKLYEKLPQELKDFLFADENSDAIENIYEKYELSNKQVAILVDSVSQVLLGVLPPSEFEKTLEIEVGLEKEVARKVSQEIFRFIFFPVKTFLEELYRVEIEPPARPAIPSGEMPEVERIRPLVEKEERSKKDIYREPIE